MRGAIEAAADEVERARAHLTDVCQTIETKRTALLEEQLPL